MGYKCDKCEFETEENITECPECFYNEILKEIENDRDFKGMSKEEIREAIYEGIIEALNEEEDSSFSKYSAAGAEFIKKNYKQAALFFALGPLGPALGAAAEHPQIKEYANRLSEEIARKYEESGTKKHVDTIKTKSGEKLDVVSGQAMYKLVEERLSLQDRYNDLLAVKLHEALERIADLEKKLLELESTKD